jgi:hypothetical protein
LCYIEAEDGSSGKMLEDERCKMKIKDFHFETQPTTQSARPKTQPQATRSDRKPKRPQASARSARSAQ